MNDPDLYSKTNDLPIAHQTHHLDKYFHLMKWKDDETIMDIGIADGRVTMEVLLPRLPTNFKKFIGCDISEDMVTFVKKKYNIPRTEFVVLDIAMEILPARFVDKFDHIFALYCLHFTEHRRSYSNIFKMLKPGGEIFATLCATSPAIIPIKILSERAKWAKYEHTKLYTLYLDFDEPEKEMVKILNEVGFENAMCRIEEISHVYLTYKHFKDFFISLNRTISEIAKEEVDEYINEYMEEMMKSDTVIVRKDENNVENVEVIIKAFVVFASKPKKDMEG